MGLWADIKGITGLGSSAGFLKRSSNGALSVDTATYLASVTTDATLTGAGTVGSPLHVVAGGATGNGSAERVLDANLSIAAGYSYVCVGPLQTSGYVLTIAATGRLEIL